MPPEDGFAMFGQHTPEPFVYVKDPLHSVRYEAGVIAQHDPELLETLKTLGIDLVLMYDGTGKRNFGEEIIPYLSGGLRAVYGDGKIDSLSAYELHHLALGKGAFRFWMRCTAVSSS